MPRDSRETPWTVIGSHSLAPEAPLVARLVAGAALSAGDRARISAAGAGLVRRIRSSVRPGLMEVFLAEYGLSTDEGIALMCLAEALLRVPDAETMDALIEDKIAPSDWGRHLGRSSSSLVNASTWALMLTGKVLDDREPGVAGHLRAAVKRLGEPVIRAAVARAMKEMGRQFVLGETIDSAMSRAAELEARGYTYSYDMLGEAARTEADARRYHLAYSRAITAIAGACTGPDTRRNPGISVKLSALHPRYEVAKRDRVMAELVPRVRALAGLARAAGLGFNIDAEEADRLALSLEVIEAVLADPSLAGWDGFGVVVQAYGRRAGAVIDWLHALAVRLDRRIMVRLVKGAYWDAEVKRAQVLGLAGFPVFTRKEATDVSYIANARKLLGMTDRIYPQFATHNAHTVAAILDMAGDPGSFEFQRLHGMGERLHDIVMSDHGTRCRIYAPVGAHRDLLAYLVRRLLENGANSSFVNQIVNEDVTPEQVAACPLTAMERIDPVASPALPAGPALFDPRRNSRGFDLTDAADLALIEQARAPHRDRRFDARPRLAGPVAGGLRRAVHNPATGAIVGHVLPAATPDVQSALQTALPWDAAPSERAEILNRAADLYEAGFGPIFALLAREAGKTLADAVGELREAVDFLRYYAQQATALTAPARGIFACISPWNFPLAIFTGQIAAALATGNAVLAKPAEQTPLIATLAVDLLLKAGVPATALQLLPGDGTVGAALTRDPRVAGVAFTGSTETALKIRAAMAEHLHPGAPLIAETGGLNAMLVDSTALPEQAVRDILASAFQSAGQRCSALRCLYVQEDVAETVTEMLFGAMDDLALGDPWQLATDIGPVINAEAQASIAAHIAEARAEGRVLKELAAPPGTFIAPTVLRVSGIAQMPREIFGPVLHIATFRANDIDAVIDAVNATGYGLTFGLHSRIDDRVQRIVDRLRVGNIYVNRNQIGAVVGSQPFGGEGLSGTGPKAGGPHYLPRFTAHPAPQGQADQSQTTAELAQTALLTSALPDAPVPALILPGPTGESNRLVSVARAPLLCLGPGAATALAQAEAVRSLGGEAVQAPGLPPDALASLTGFSGALFWGAPDLARPCARAMAQRQGPILPLITGQPDRAHVRLERHICIDTTASGGNAKLLAQAAQA
ncbi:MAG: bifunctional proline dehydrogenase/L-glutamate gamma-semialdehyde dehydrogenase PutA [Rhodobacter sp.]|nr:bifunctional proline dehydrogenase/L-glutamate gamma-semialdehyde dehydrogenase PutA [Rhodobacter sp.]MCA3518936.1 bifunctional proline dehydrogenase/L-glutamate gamma-semialdehyde dehydrogenase PutA [Rhodobacter sp.]MCA3523179.1 bifunctional proline dehydrogenase/L-glutamate gamma-semialdehyde dehydrogenase PutA [Rhodobacter sp.]MCA3525750.1 bifunctional proline dehydrogenase/L-glutamate gamma-semialdehyde dehydrogenase PutA [Rhodobacter sp.]MCA3528295.1 bifunctional proline dehydrogenase/L